jgi:hypothetical protein
MNPEPLVACEEVVHSPERIGADEQTSLGPPEGDFLPPAPHPDRNELEWRQARGGYDMVRHAETLRQLGAVSVMPVEQLQDPGRLAGGPDPTLHAVAQDWIDRPNAPGGDEHVRTARHELIHDPAKAAVELVARLEDLQRCHIAAHVS